jgi:hypothetical protein
MYKFCNFGGPVSFCFLFRDERNHHNRVSVDNMLLVCGTRYQFLFCRYWQHAILQGYLGARQDGDQIATILHHHHLITNILQGKMVVILDQGQMC